MPMRMGLAGVAGVPKASDEEAPEAPASVSVELVGGLDHHSESWSRDHPGMLQQGFDAIATTMGELIAEGKIKSWGLCNETPYGVCTHHSTVRSR